MQVKYLEEPAEFVNKLQVSDRSRVDRITEFFCRYGFAIGPKYVKKISTKGIWELRAGKIRLLLCVAGETVICVHAIYKKTQKLRKGDIRLAETRSRLL
jgi:phage-related protein